MAVKYLNQHIKSLKTCPECETLFKPNFAEQLFCGHSCSASATNRKRGPRAEETKQKIRTTLTKTITSGPQSKPKKVVAEIVGEYSKIQCGTCAHCGQLFTSRLKQKYCSNHSELYKSANRNKYAFTFSIGDHPLLFGHMSDALKSVGMWSYSNTDGITRDHRVSANEAIRNNHDPFYIKHPVNCELMGWVENNQKKTKSSITYVELVKQVDEYEQNLKKVAPRAENDSA